MNFSLLNYDVGDWTLKDKKVEWLKQLHPWVLIHNAKVNESLARIEKTSHHEIEAAVRAAGICEIKDVQLILLMQILFLVRFVGILVTLS